MTETDPYPDSSREQTDCPCCGVWDACLIPKDYPEDWQGVAALAAQRCIAVSEVFGQCRCWGGPDRECADCWLASK